MNRSSVISVPVVVKPLKSIHYLLHLLGRCNEVRYSEVVGARRLLESTSRNSHNTGLVYHIHAVDEVGFFTRLLSFF